MKIDSIMKPGGETEISMIGHRLKLPMPKPDEEERQTGIQKVSTLPLMGTLALGTAMSAPLIAEWWQNNANTKQRENAIRSLENKLGLDSDNDRYCDVIDRKNRDTCNEVTKTKGSREGAACNAQASNIYAACRSGKPENQWPPLGY